MQFLSHRFSASLNYMPMRYPDELWISWLARYKLHLGLRDDDALDSLLGTSYGIPGIDFTHKLRHFTKLLSEISNETFVDFLNNSTLWPYFSFFFEPAKKREFLDFLERGRRGKGPVKLRIRECRSPVYCPLCVEADTKDFGECYFHRAHQIPEIFICTTHNCYLEQVSTKEFFKEVKLIPASLEICPLKDPIKNDDQLLFGIGKKMVAILHRENQDNHDSNDYLQLAQKSIGVKNKLHVTGFNKHLSNFYGTEMLNLYRSEERIGIRRNKLLGYDFWKKSEWSYRPINNILAEHFFDNRQCTQQAEQDEILIAWKCTYPLCTGTHCRSIRKLKRSYEIKCCCGTKYITEIFKQKRIFIVVDLNQAFVDAIVQESINKSKSALSREYGIGRSRLTKIIQSRGQSRLRVNKPAHIEAFKTEWLKILHDTNFRSLTQAREQNATLYGQLYVYEREWLIKVNRPLRTHGGGKIPGNYGKMDADLAMAVRLKYNELLESKISRTVTFRFLALESGVSLNLVRSDKTLLPITKKLLSELAETLPQSRLRRVKHAVALLIKEGKKVSRNQVKVLTCIPFPKFTPEINAYIARHIDAEQIS